MAGGVSLSYSVILPNYFGNLCFNEARRDATDGLFTDQSSLSNFAGQLQSFLLVCMLVEVAGLPWWYAVPVI